MERIRDSFDRQGFMRTLGAVLESVEPGTVTITCGFDEALTQQHGLFHGGVVASLVDVACGYAALSVMPADREVLTVEFKVHFLKPAKTDRVIAVGQVVQAGRTLTVCEGSVFDGTRTRVLARMTATDDGGCRDFHVDDRPYERPPESTERPVSDPPARAHLSHFRRGARGRVQRCSRASSDIVPRCHGPCRPARGPRSRRW